MIRLKTSEFKKFKELIYKIAGIHMKPEKIVLIENRLAKKVREFELKSYSEYYEMVLKDKDELQVMVNLLTTNETSFFRENKHFEFLKNRILPEIKSELKIWSAASSTGAEGYSIAMVVDDYFSNRYCKWEILLSDINEEVVKTSMTGIYPMKYTGNIPSKFLKKYCLKGVGKKEGCFLINDYLKSKLKYMTVNLNRQLPSNIGLFDVIFLRNILIYFDNDKKKQIVDNVVSRLKDGGYLFIGHSETLNKITDSVKMIVPTVYKK